MNDLYGLTVLCCTGDPLIPTAEYQSAAGEWQTWSPSSLGLDMGASPATDMTAGLAVSGVAGFKPDEAADLEAMGAASERARWVFRCGRCGTVVPARAERLQAVAERLRSFGVPSVPLKELGGILEKF